ncbi:MAG TPA: D-alanyl-D-alanine carboxypeptidase/D-alanyl-D-alanine-endopeptidase [Gemmatimonadales bacterium]
MLRRSFLALTFAAAFAFPAIAQERPRGPLASELSRYMTSRTWRYATWGALVVSLTHGDTLFSWRADEHFVPASNAKLFTTAAALHYLGDDYQFLTVLFADGPIRGGDLYGDLVLYGTGDPTFALDTASLAPFADSVVLAGIHRIRGDIVGDASFLGAELSGPGWSPDNLDESYAAPPSALGAAENIIKLIVEPGRRAGQPATYRLEPANDYYHISNLVLTSAHGRTHISVRRGESRGVVELTGTIPVSRSAWTTSIVVQDPAVFVAGLLRQLLAARGVTVTGNTRAVTEDAPARAHLMLQRSQGARDAFAGAIAVRRSETLDDLVSMINHRSHNLSAELALRSIGRRVGNSGTFASGARAVRSYLTDKVGIPASAVQVTDGSGLSVLDATTPRALVQLLSYERGTGGSQAFFKSLPIFGESGRRRMTSTAAAGVLRAKTGTLTGVSALSGYVTASNGEELAFSLIVNNSPSTRRARAVQDSIGARLALYAREQAPARASGN